MATSNRKTSLAPCVDYAASQGLPLFSSPCLVCGCAPRTIIQSSILTAGRTKASFCEFSSPNMNILPSIGPMRKLIEVYVNWPGHTHDHRTNKIILWATLLLKSYWSAKFPSPPILRVLSFSIFCFCLDIALQGYMHSLYNYWTMPAVHCPGHLRGVQSFYNQNFNFERIQMLLFTQIIYIL